MAGAKVAVTDQVFPSVAVERDVIVNSGGELTVADGDRDQVLEAVRDADGLLNTYLPLDKEFIDGLSRCRVIARYGIGVDNIDLDAAAAKGIVVTNVPDYCIEEVATHTVALALAHLRKVTTADATLRRGGWGIRDIGPIPRLSDLMVGLVGHGRIGTRVGSAFSALGAAVQVYDPFLPPDTDVRAVDDLETLLRTSDIISLHVPLTAQTRGLIGVEEIGWCRPNALLVNTSRGGLVELGAVLEALGDGRLGGAALDVFDQEPLDPSRIEGTPNLIATPHIAFYSDAAIAESQHKAATQVVKVLSGARPDYPVGGN